MEFLTTFLCEDGRHGINDLQSKGHLYSSKSAAIAKAEALGDDYDVIEVKHIYTHSVVGYVVEHKASTRFVRVRANGHLC